MIKRILAMIFSIIMLCTLPTFAADTEIINGDFESGSIAFTGISHYREAIYRGQSSGFLCVPQQTESGDYVHTGEYIYTVFLQEGILYNFNISIRGFKESEKNTKIEAAYNSGKARIYFDIKDISTKWTELSCSFVAGTTGDFDIGINVYTDEMGALVDDISIQKSTEKPVKMEIFGHRNAYVSSPGYRTYSYTAAAVNAKGEVIPVIKGGVYFENLPEGVEIYDDSTVMVTSQAKEGDYFTVKTAITPENSGLMQGVVNVKLGNNMIENGRFEDLPRDNDIVMVKGECEIVQNTAGFSAKITNLQKEDKGYVASFTTEQTYVLKPGKMYVFRATVSADVGHGSEEIYTSNEIDHEGTLNINVFGINTEKRIHSVIRVLNEGIYKIRFNFTVSDDTSVFVSDMGIYEEESKIEEILIKAPGHITIPEDKIYVPIICAGKDQEGNINEKPEGITVKTVESIKGVSVENNILCITSEAKSGKVELEATEDGTGVNKRFTTEISTDSIGDGENEIKDAGEWVYTASPSLLEFVGAKEAEMENASGNVAKLSMNGDVSAVLFDSVNVYKPGQVYVFGGNFKKKNNTHTLMSLLLYEASDINYSNGFALFQATLEDGNFTAVFIPNREITGRIMIGFNTLDKSIGQEIYFDGLYTEKAVVSCSNISVSGYPYDGMVLSGKHRFEANFNATEISTYRWLSSSTVDGMFMPIEGENGETLSISEKLIDTYVKFEVTPISLNGPVFGESKTSSPVKILPMPSGGEVVKLPENPMVDTPFEPETSTDESAEIKGLEVVDISSVNIKEGGFVDTQNHWAKEEIDLLSACSVVNGMGNMLFMPDEEITRAQFSAFIIRAFSLAPLHYSGTFDDVKSHNWYSGAVETVTKYAIANGVSSTLFAPEEPVTREQMTVMIARSLHLAGINIKNAPQSTFSDYDSINEYAREYVNTAVQCGIISGFPDGTLKPQKTATRAEAVVIIKRMIEFVNNGGELYSQ